MRQARGFEPVYPAGLVACCFCRVVGDALQFNAPLRSGTCNIISKPIIMPWLLRKTSPSEVYTRREVEQVLNIPTALLIALVLTIFLVLALPLQNALPLEFRGPNVPIGIAGMLLGAFTLTVRREALPLLIGLLAMENGAFLPVFQFRIICHCWLNWLLLQTV